MSDMLVLRRGISILYLSVEKDCLLLALSLLFSRIIGLYKLPAETITLFALIVNALGVAFLASLGLQLPIMP